MSPDMPQAWTLAFNTTKAGAFAERGLIYILLLTLLFLQVWSLAFNSM
jgi:hypothetical protein